MEVQQLHAQHVRMLVYISPQQLQSLNITKEFSQEQSLLKAYTEVLVDLAHLVMVKLEDIVSHADRTVLHVTKAFVPNVLQIWFQELMDGVLLIVL